MMNIKMTPAELNLYCGLLPLAYDLYKEKTGGMVCGSACEELRDKMFLAIKCGNFLANL